MESKRCIACAEEILVEATLCKHCQVNQVTGRLNDNPVTIAIQTKSPGLAVFLTILWPGVGHLYLGLTKRGVPFVVANAIGLVLALTIILSPITVLIWLVTMFMTVFRISTEAQVVNAAIRSGREIHEL